MKTVHMYIKKKLLGRVLSTLSLATRTRNFFNFVIEILCKNEKLKKPFLPVHIHRTHEAKKCLKSRDNVPLSASHPVINVRYTGNNKIVYNYPAKIRLALYFSYEQIKKVLKIHFLQFCKGFSMGGTLN